MANRYAIAVCLWDDAGMHHTEVDHSEKGCVPSLEAETKVFAGYAVDVLVG